MSDTVNDIRKKRKAALFKMAILLAFLAIIFVFASIAWFSGNDSVSAGGMGVSVATDRFEITMLDNSTNGIFYTPYHQKVKDENAMVWKMTANNNLINYNSYVDEDDPGDLGIKPGSEGVISFNVIPKADSVTLDFDFEIVGYQSSKDENNNDALVMTPLSEIAGDNGATLQELLNGHILLFENMTETTENGVTKRTYLDPILSDASMHRLMNRSFTETTQVNIFWVWPNTLSTLVDAHTFSGITAEPFCSGDSYDAITDNIEAYPQYYLKGTDSSDSIDVQTIVQHYDIYGDKYDQGDNAIGMCVHYLLIKLSITEASAVGGEP